MVLFLTQTVKSAYVVVSVDLSLYGILAIPKVEATESMKKCSLCDKYLLKLDVELLDCKIATSHYCLVIIHND